MIEKLSDRELVHHVDNKPSATPLERELANRLDAASQRIAMYHQILDKKGIDEDDML